jgi:hypothetical protein
LGSPYAPLGQITVAPISAAQAVQDVLAGSGIITSNINAFTTNPNSIGVFDNGLQSDIGINRGIVLTSGLVTGTPLFGDAASQFKSAVNNGETDPDLNSIASGTIDRAVLQFDFVPEGDTLKFKYVFASEEYPEFVGAPFNDVFAFFLTGPNPSGPAYNLPNIALLPGTATPVSINNVNQNTDTIYFVSNVSNNFVFDGYTAVLSAIAPVIPYSSYTIKLAISDVGDKVYDSAVFLEENSFTTGGFANSSSYNETKFGTKIYPNPNNGEFILENNHHFSDLGFKIFNQSGKLVHTGHCSDKISSLDLRLPAGFYYLKTEKEVLKTIITR